jgi:hypothetical protein
MKILLAIDYALGGQRLEHPPHIESWRRYIDELQKVADTLKGCEPLGLGCWLLNSPEHVPLLETALRKYEGLKFPYRIIFLNPEDADTWKIVPKSA